MPTPRSSPYLFVRAVAWRLTVAVFAMWLVGTTRVQASCGDHLHPATPPYSEHEAPSTTWERFDRINPTKPCSGPSCRSGPQKPDEVPPSGIHLSQADRWILGPIVEFVNSTELRKHGTDDVLFLPEDHRRSLDRPPRCA